jgi:hypothetical protein
MVDGPLTSVCISLQTPKSSEVPSVSHRVSKPYSRWSSIPCSEGSVPRELEGIRTEPAARARVIGHESQRWTTAWGPFPSCGSSYFWTPFHRLNRMRNSPEALSKAGDYLPVAWCGSWIVEFASARCAARMRRTRFQELDRRSRIQGVFYTVPPVVLRLIKGHISNVK